MDTDNLLVWGLYGALLLITGVPFVWAYRRRERETRRAEAEAEKYGLNAPATLHPVVDPYRCIAIGN